MLRRCLPILVLLTVPAPLLALPQFAASEKKACSHCHFDPSGGGPRNARGEYFEDHGYSFEGYVESTGAGTEARAGSVEALLSALSFSGDLRVLYSMSEGPHAGGGTSCESCHTRGDRAPDQTFMLMQGELAVSARVSDNVSFTYSNDLGVTRDAFAVVRLGDSGAFVKAGAFQIPFGTEEIRDHNTLVKARYDVGSNLRDVGVQVALQTARHFASVSLLNGGARLPDAGPLTTPYDRNGSPAVVARAGLMASRWRVGASAMFDDSLGTSRPRETVGGLFGTVFGSRWKILGEVDVGRAKTATDEMSSLGFVALGTLSVTRDLDVTAKVDRFDPDTDAADDGETWFTAIVAHRLGRNASLEARYRGRAVETPPTEVEIGTDEFLAMLHVHF
jgi:hypothetical protein